MRISYETLALLASNGDIAARGAKYYYDGFAGIKVGRNIRIYVEHDYIDVDCLRLPNMNKRYVERNGFCVDSKYDYLMHTNRR